MFVSPFTNRKQSRISEFSCFSFLLRIFKNLINSINNEWQKQIGCKQLEYKNSRSLHFYCSNIAIGMISLIDGV